MTPTLRGRWQTRLGLNLTVGVVLTFLLSDVFHDFASAIAVLGYITVLGWGWDVVYSRLQAWRWDHDWPPILYLLGAVWEMGVLSILMQTVNLPGVAEGYGLLAVLLQYSMIGLLSFLLMFGPLRVLFPRWRFRGGQWR
ncbi:MAG: hypothetical protein H6636_01365 [Anaerolineales bacterium]|nr:hypothetical protein [Anaerolineales bacterium]